MAYKGAFFYGLTLGKMASHDRKPLQLADLKQEREAFRLPLLRSGREGKAMTNKELPNSI